jgi:uncharacterized membrane protein HdeD (DUF308 family)
VLSDEERRRLEELERALAAQDPELTHRLSLGPKSRVLLAAAAVAAGVVLLITGIAAKLTVVGVAGFVLMCAGAYRYAGLRFPVRRFP